MKFRNVLRGCILSVATLAGATGLQAQDLKEGQSSLPRDADISGDGVGDIVVTAQHRRENLQRVPISITAISGDVAQQFGTIRTGDLPKLVPSLVINFTNSSPLIFMRGIGSPSGANPGMEGAVGVYLDGVYLPSTNSGIFSLDGIERVEVLKGPQGTLFGRNNTGGVVHIITKTPGRTPEGSFHIGYGNYDTWEAGGYINQPLGERAAINISAHWKDQGAGWGTNLYNGKDINLNREHIIRAKLKVDTGEDGFIVLAADYGHASGDLGAIARPTALTVPYDKIPVAGFYDGNIDGPASNSGTSYGSALTVEQNMPFATLTSITSYRVYEQKQVQDADMSSASLYNASVPYDQDTFSQEIRLASNGDSAFKWLAGLYYFNSRVNTVNQTVGGSYTPAGGLVTRASQISRSYAGFAQGSYAFDERATVTLGGRYTFDEKTIEGNSVVGGTNTLYIAKKHGFVNREPTWRAAFDYKIGDFMPYVSYDHGFRSGALNVANPLAAATRPELVDQYEAGLKGALFDRKLTFSSAFFYIHAKDLQLSRTNFGGSIILLNATTATIKGAELNLTAQPARNFTFRAGIVYQHGEYGDFPGAPLYIALPTGGAAPIFINAKGNKTIRTPAFTSSVSADYRIPSPVGDFGISASYYHSSRYFFDVGNSAVQKAYDVVNGSVGWTAPSGSYGINLWARNIFGEKYYTRFDSAGFGFNAVAAEPRVFGVSLSVNYQ